MLFKVHLRLALLCAGITSLVIGLMSLTYLYVSEKNLNETYYSSFQNDMNTLLSNFGSQSVITHKWLSQMEGGGKYILDLRDNGVAFLWGNRSGEENAQRSAAITAGWNYFHQNYQLAPASPYATTHLEFDFSLSGHGPSDYYGCVAVSARENGSLTLLILKTLAPLRDQIHTQRLIFAALVAAACIVLGLLSWYFVGKLLSPVEKSRQSQIRFVASASHELRTPLSVILSAVSACRKCSPDDQEKFFTIIQEEGESMSRLISDLLTLAGTDSDTFSLQKKQCEMDTLLLNTFEVFEVLAHEKGYSLSVSLPDRKIPSVSCDKDRIRQVLSILLHNAFCYVPPGSHILLSLYQTQQGISLSVSDDGPGISDEDKAHIFERFYRADAARNDSGHFGLGLSIAREIMRAHHGTLTVHDTPGGGATFTLTLPG